jgi:hypothetical protein
MSEENNIDIGIEQILATILFKVGPVKISSEELTKDYSQYAVSVDPSEDNSFEFSLVDLGEVNLEEIAE